MASNCDLWCFYKCRIPINFSSGDPTQISNDLESMADCMTHVCQLDYLDKNITELANVYSQQLLAVRSNVNKTIEIANCTFKFHELKWMFQSPKYAVPILGYLCPIIIFLTIISNSLVIIVLMKPHMRSPSNVILVAMALSSLFTGLFPLPVYLHFFTTERLYEWVPYNWCYAHDILTGISDIFHMTSVWLTVALTAERYIVVCHPLKARTWCTTRRIMYAIIAIYVVATLTCITQLFDGYYAQTEARTRLPSRLRQGQYYYVSACVHMRQPSVERNSKLSLEAFSAYWLIFVIFLPCVGLIVMNGLLIHTLRLARIRRRQLFGQNREIRKLEESNRTTLILVVVVCIFILTEASGAVFLIFAYIIQRKISNITEKVIDVQSSSLVFMDLIILLSYPLSLCIYCYMGRRFRRTFKQMFCHICSGANLTNEVACFQMAPVSWTSTVSGKKDSQYTTVSTNKRSKAIGNSVDKGVQYCQEDLDSPCQNASAMNLRTTAV